MQEVMSPTFKHSAQQIILGSSTNPLLVKDDVGKAKPFTHRLPKGDFCYGKADLKNLESAGQGKLFALYNFAITFELSFVSHLFVGSFPKVQNFFARSKGL